MLTVPMTDTHTCTGTFGSRDTFGTFGTRDTFGTFGTRDTHLLTGSCAGDSFDSTTIHFPRYTVYAVNCTLYTHICVYTCGFVQDVYTDLMVCMCT